MTDTSSTAVEPAMWRKIANFPLVSMILALVVVVLGIIAVGYSLAQFDPPANAWVREGMPVILAVIVTFALYKLVIVRLGERPKDDLPLGPAAKDFALGTVGAGLLMTAIVGGAALLGGYAIAGWGGSESLPMILFAGGLQAAFIEEVISRGIIFRFLEEFGGSWFALALSSIFFGFMHAGNDNATLLSSIAISIEAGVLLGGAYMLTRNLWLAIGIHFGWNVVQGYIWDVPVSGHAVDGLVDSRATGSELISGGAFGLEASVIAMVLATLAGIWLVVMAARRGNIVQPWWTRRRLAREAAAEAHPPLA